jgi:hypothetical protein
VPECVPRRESRNEQPDRTGDHRNLRHIVLLLCGPAGPFAPGRTSAPLRALPCGAPSLRARFVPN